MSAAEIQILEAPEPEHAAPPPTPVASIVLGTLVGFANDGTVPLVTYPGQPQSAAQAADAILDIHAAHIGRRVVLQFAAGDPPRPIIMGVLSVANGWPAEQQCGQVEVTADGARMIVTAREQLVLKCGRASITLTKAGKILVKGTYVSNHSTGVLRVKGGSVQIN